MGNISPGWRKPVPATRADRQRIEGTIRSIERSARFYADHDMPNAAARAREHADEWRRRLKSLAKSTKVQ